LPICSFIHVVCVIHMLQVTAWWKSRTPFAALFQSQLFADAILLAGLAPLSPAPSAFPCQAGSQLELVPTSSPAEHQPVWATWRGSERRLWLTGHGERILQSFGPFLPPLPAFLSVLRQSRHELTFSRHKQRSNSSVRRYWRMWRCPNKPMLQHSLPLDEQGTVARYLVSRIL
jgi:hypothetical protein